jgi:RNA polymerase sigma-70 factor (ECF subfamily)
MKATVRHLRPVESVPVVESSPSDELEVLFQEHYDQIYRTAYRITGNPMDAEDVLQTVFLRLARREKIATDNGQRTTDILDLQPNATAYLMRSAINASLDIMRSRTRSRSVSIDEVDIENLGQSFMNPETEHEDAELRKLIRSAVSKLGTKAAEMFALRYFEGYGNREIAEILGTSQMVVGVILHRSRSKMRKEIGEYLNCGLRIADCGFEEDR